MYSGGLKEQATVEKIGSVVSEKACYADRLFCRLPNWDDCILSTA